MPAITMSFGIGLIILGVGTWIGAGQTSLTAMIPAFFGLPLLLIGAAARRESWRKHAMHAAAVIALLGAGGALSRALPSVFAGDPMRLATVSQLVMGVGLIVFLVLCIRSFIQARQTGVS